MSFTAPLKVTAPAKVILFGEHAVVYGQPAIAVPVSAIRAQAIIKPNPQFSIVAQDTGQLLTLEHLTQLVDDALARMTALTLDFLQADAPPVTIMLSSAIPPASGLGSGAAVSACLGRAIAAACGRDIADADLNTLVYEVERIYHGTPSGIDNTVIVYEQPVYFVREQPIIRLSITHPLHLLIADTGKAALTKDSVGDVRRLYEAARRTTEALIVGIGEVAQRARAALENGDTVALGHLMDDNHALLRQLTVSSPELDALVDAARQAGALGAKLSGGGRGGNMIALVNTADQPRVEAALRAAGAVRVLSTQLGKAETHADDA